MNRHIFGTILTDREKRRLKEAVCYMDSSCSMHGLSKDDCQKCRETWAEQVIVAYAAFCLIMEEKADFDCQHQTPTIRSNGYKTLIEHIKQSDDDPESIPESSPHI